MTTGFDYPQPYLDGAGYIDMLWEGTQIESQEGNSRLMVLITV